MDCTLYNVPKSVLNGSRDVGVYVKYYQDKAYISVNSKSIYFDNHQGITLVNYSDPENPTIITSNPNFYLGKFSNSAELTQDGSIITFIDEKWKLVTLRGDNLTLLDNHLMINHANYQPLIRRVEGYNLFYTSHAEGGNTPQYSFYYIDETGEVTFVDFDAHKKNPNFYIGNMGVMDGDKYFLIENKRNDNFEWESHKFIYDISNLPEITLL